MIPEVWDLNSSIKELLVSLKMGVVNPKKEEDNNFELSIGVHDSINCVKMGYIKGVLELVFA